MQWRAWSSLTFARWRLAPEAVWKGMMGGEDKGSASAATRDFAHVIPPACVQKGEANAWMVCIVANARP